MFKKVLIAEDHEIANISVRKTLEELGVNQTEYVYYCDHALTWIKNALRAAEPYELLITDLYFDDDHSPQNLQDGIALIRAARAVQPDLCIIVFSSEGRQSVIDNLFSDIGINAYVRKARRDAAHFHEAVQAVARGRTYVSPDARQLARQMNTYEFAHLDTEILSLLAQGILQKDIPQHLKAKGLSPSGLSSVEKRLGLMKSVLGFSKNEQLIAYCKDLGVI